MCARQKGKFIICIVVFLFENKRAHKCVWMMGCSAVTRRRGQPHPSKTLILLWRTRNAYAAAATTIATHAYIVINIYHIYIYNICVYANWNINSRSMRRRKSRLHLVIHKSAILFAQRQKDWCDEYDVCVCGSCVRQDQTLEVSERLHIWCHNEILIDYYFSFKKKNIFDPI